MVFNLKNTIDNMFHIDRTKIFVFGETMKILAKAVQYVHEWVSFVLHISEGFSTNSYYMYIIVFNTRLRT